MEGWEEDESLFLPVTITNTMERDLGFGAYCRVGHLYQGKWQAVYGSRPCPALVNTVSARGAACKRQYRLYSGSLGCRGLEIPAPWRRGLSFSPSFSPSLRI